MDLNIVYIGDFSDACQMSNDAIARCEVFVHADGHRIPEEVVFTYLSNFGVERMKIGQGNLSRLIEYSMNLVVLKLIVPF